MIFRNSLQQKVLKDNEKSVKKKYIYSVYVEHRW